MKKSHPLRFFFNACSFILLSLVGCSRAQNIPVYDFNWQNTNTPFIKPILPHNTGNGHGALVNNAAYSGVRFQLNKDDSLVAGGTRANLYINEIDSTFREFEFTDSFPMDWKKDTVPVFIWSARQTSKYNGVYRAGTATPLTILIVDGHWRMWNQYNNVDMKDNKVFLRNFDLGEFTEFGKTVTFRIKVKFSVADDGYIKIYKNGELLQAAYGANHNRIDGHQDTYPGLKWGLYIPKWNNKSWEFAVTERVYWCQRMALYKESN